MNGQDVRKIREVTKMTQAELARLLGVTVTTISQWEREATSIHPLMAEGIKAKTKHLITEKVA